MILFGIVKKELYHTSHCSSNNPKNTSFFTRINIRIVFFFICCLKITHSIFIFHQKLHRISTVNHSNNHVSYCCRKRGIHHNNIFFHQSCVNHTISFHLKQYCRSCMFHYQRIYINKIRLFLMNINRHSCRHSIK